MESIKGGKRMGAGRKSFLQKKEPITVYVEKNLIIKVGTRDDARTFMYNSLKDYGEVSNTSIEIETQKVNTVIDEPKGNYFAPAPIQPIVTQFQSFVIEINDCVNNEQLEKTMTYVRKDKSITDKQLLQLEILAKKVFADKGFYKE